MMPKQIGLEGNRWCADFGSEASKGLAELSFDVVVGADGRHQTVPGYYEQLCESFVVTK